MIGNKINFDTTQYMGDARAGKTLSLVHDGLELWKNILLTAYDLRNSEKELKDYEKKKLNMLENFEIWSNLRLNKSIFGEYKFIGIPELLELYENKIKISNKILLFDDIFKYLDSREFMKNKNKVMSYLITEIGKEENILKYVSHYKEMVEIRLTKFTENFVLCKKGEIKKLKGTDVSIWKEFENYFSMENSYNSEVLERTYIKRIGFKEKVDYSQEWDRIKRKSYGFDFIKITDCFKLYDTKQIV